MKGVRASAGWICVPLVLLSTACAETADESARRTSDAAAAEALVAELLPAAERLSGMRSTGEVRVVMTGPADVRRYIESRLDVYLPGDQLEGMRRSYVMLGLLPDTLDLRALLLDLYGEQVAGFYDPDTESLHIVATETAGPLEPVILHELVHALQDQHVDLDSLIAQRGLNDRQAAAQAAIEGHATLAMFAWMAESMSGDTVNPGLMADPGESVAGLFAGNDQFPVFRDAPRIIRETLLFPYVAGASFVHALWRTRTDRPPPFGGLLPQSTEQVADPRARFINARDEPTELRHDAVAGYEAVWENTLGAFETGILVEEIGGGADGARGWAGDRFTLYGGRTGDILVWTSVWDDPSSADRFVNRIAGLFERTGRPGFSRRIDIEGRPGVRVTVGAEQAEAPDPAVHCTNLTGERVAC